MARRGLRAVQFDVHQCDRKVARPTTCRRRPGADIDAVRRWLGQKPLAMAIRYSETAGASKRMRGMIKKSPVGTQRRTKVSNSAGRVCWLRREARGLCRKPRADPAPDLRQRREFARLPANGREREEVGPRFHPAAR